MATGGLYVTFDMGASSGGALRPAPPETALGPGPGSILVTDADGTDITAAVALMNAGCAVPFPLNGAFTVSLNAVKAAVAAHTYVVLTRL